MKTQNLNNFKINTMHSKALNTFSSIDWSPYVTAGTNNRGQEQILRESEAEFKRKGSFVLVFPSPLSAVSLYKNLLQSHTSSTIDSIN